MQRIEMKPNEIRSKMHLTTNQTVAEAMRRDKIKKKQIVQQPGTYKRNNSYIVHQTTNKQVTILHQQGIKKELHDKM